MSLNYNINKKYPVRFIVDTVNDKKDIHHSNISTALLGIAQQSLDRTIPQIMVDKTIISYRSWMESFQFSDGLSSHTICVYFMTHYTDEKLRFLKSTLQQHKHYRFIIVLCSNCNPCIQLINNSIPVTYIVEVAHIAKELPLGILTAVSQLNYLTGKFGSHVIAYQSDMAKGNGCTLECRLDQNNRTVRASLKQILDNANFGKTKFVQINKSTVINLDYILKIEPSFDEVHMICAYNENGETTFPISRNYKKSLKEAYYGLLLDRNSPEMREIF